MIGGTIQRKITISTLYVESQALEALESWKRTRAEDSSINKTTSDEKVRKLDKAIPPPPFFFRLASNWVGRSVGLKKKT